MTQQEKQKLKAIINAVYDSLAGMMNCVESICAKSIR